MTIKLYYESQEVRIPILKEYQARSIWNLSNGLDSILKARFLSKISINIDIIEEGIMMETVYCVPQPTYIVVEQVHTKTGLPYFVGGTIGP